MLIYFFFLKLKNALCFIMGYFFDIQIYFMLFLAMHVFARYIDFSSIGSINVCANFEINPYNIEFVSWTYLTVLICKCNYVKFRKLL